MIRLAIVSPCYNEEAVLDESAARLTKLLNELIEEKSISPDSFVLYINDGSKDKTWPIIQRLHSENPFICGLNLAANVGHQNAIMAGMMRARLIADATVTIDADLQDDIQAIKKMVALHAQGNDIVYGVKVSREADPWLKKMTAQMFYRIQEKMGVKSVYNHADFRFMSKRALNALAEYPERNLYLRGMIPMIGFQSATVDDVISPRLAGQSKYTLQKMLRLASDGITSFSTKPIELIITVGLLMMLIAIGMFCYVIVSLITNHYTAGWASIMMSMWFIGSVVTLGIGVVGTYIGKIYIEVKQRPLYNIADELLQPADEAKNN